jgi:hypothetical protein
MSSSLAFVSCVAGALGPGKRRAIADLLFSTALDSSGRPQGIGLSGWRFNIGAGSAEQGKGSGIDDEWRRAECFLQRDGTYAAAPLGRKATIRPHSMYVLF